MHATGNYNDHDDFKLNYDYDYGAVNNNFKLDLKLGRQHFLFDEFKLDHWQWVDFYFRRVVDRLDIDSGRFGARFLCRGGFQRCRIPLVDLCRCGRSLLSLHLCLGRSNTCPIAEDGDRQY
jgi:hypothetical protein